jgi:hypothetical protein
MEEDEPSELKNATE